MRPGTKITSFPPQSTTLTLTPVQPIIPISQTIHADTIPQTSPFLPPPIDTLPQQPQNIGLPPELVAEEPVTFSEDITIDELIEIRKDVGKNSPLYWPAFDLIQKKRDEMFEIHHNSLMKAMQDLTIAMYKTNKMKVPKTVGEPFESD